MNDDGKEKMEQIGKIIDAMPESVDEEFLCNLFASVIWTYRFEKSAMMIMAMTYKIVGERMEEWGEGETFH
jgi:hypothetical protein